MGENGVGRIKYTSLLLGGYRWDLVNGGGSEWQHLYYGGWLWDGGGWRLCIGSGRQLRGRGGSSGRLRKNIRPLLVL